MTENMQIAMTAINKWVYYSLNYRVAPYTYQYSGRTVYVPTFILEVQWTCPLCHMVDKWGLSIRSGEPHAYLVKFYTELDLSNRKLMLDWILNHYNDEINLID